MNNPVFDKIIQELKLNNIDFQLIEHKPVYTMQQANKVVGSLPSQEVKVLFVKIYKTKKNYNFYIIAWTGNKKTDFDKITQILKRKKIKLASPDNVKINLGIEIGALSPFGYNKKYPVIIDSQLLKQTKLFINPGLHDKTIVIQPKGFTTLINKLSEKTYII